jgi:hypothetical protein
VFRYQYCSREQHEKKRTTRKSSSSSTASSTSLSSQGWKLLTSAFDRARLPHFVLPIKWNETNQVHQKLAYDPARKQAFNIEKQKATYRGLSMIRLTPGQNSLPGCNTPEAAQVQLLNDPRLQENIIEDIEGTLLAPCFAHGDIVAIETLQDDHADAKAHILKRQQQLVGHMNSDSDFYTAIMQLESMNKFFVKNQL